VVRHLYQPGDTALHGAVAIYDVEAAKILLYAGADKNIRNKAGKTPLDIAIDGGKTEMIKLLMDW
jgi:ankyrin repeat protein